MSARSVLDALGWQPHQARTLAMRFRRHNIAQIDAIALHWKDEDKLIAAARQGRQQLEELFAQERGDAAQRQVTAGWAREGLGRVRRGGEVGGRVGREARADCVWSHPQIFRRSIAWGVTHSAGRQARPFTGENCYDPRNTFRNGPHPDGCWASADNTLATTRK